MIKKLRRIFLNIIYQKQPSFIISYKYFIPSPNTYIRTHRAIFFRNFRRPDIILSNILATFKWVSYQAWISSYKISKNISEEKLLETGHRNKFTLYIKLIKLSLANFITPNYYLKYKLYKNDPLSFFYYKEIVELHLYSDRKNKDFRKYNKLIANKYQFLNFLNQHNIQANYSCKKSFKEIVANTDILFQKQKIFCKPNIANQSSGALCIYFDLVLNDYKLLTLVDKKGIIGKDNITSFIKFYYLNSDEILIEKFIEDDEEIKAISNHPTDATTMRIITASLYPNNHKPKPIYIQLEIPLLENNGEHQFYNILPLDLINLDINLKHMPDFKDKKSFENMKLSQNLKDKIRRACNMSIEAHSKLNIRAIAFDIIISTDVPIIIEANYNWDVELLYRIFQPNESNSLPIKTWLQNL
ncbi:hypothetical protein [Francisella frigiditurris]|uniref:Alpha-L-glutamate ligase-related protein ATP-grasp domain-containing protein n=1 Tax=Francisella frigiditurris TaxID=1542390 RepID=A0A1J0KRQ2_9GAMM|nr:hypothetical protein [Francisella frigiditurris]APC96456.1 hypothetical protein KX01_483 [Francisella frigiditurris]